MRSGRTFLPHHDARITSGASARTASGVTMRSLASEAPRNCGNTGVPPATSTSSSTQRMPEINGSSHSSKNTRGRWANRAAETRMASSPPSSSSASASARAARPTMPPRIADHLQDLGDAPLIERHDGIAATNQLGRERRLQIGEREDQVGAQRVDLVESRVQKRRHLGFLASLRRPCRVTRHANHPVTGAEPVQRLGRLFCQTDNALRVRGHASIVARSIYSMR